MIQIRIWVCKRTWVTWDNSLISDWKPNFSRTKRYWAAVPWHWPIKHDDVNEEIVEKHSWSVRKWWWILCRHPAGGAGRRGSYGSYRGEGHSAQLHVMQLGSPPTPTSPSPLSPPFTPVFFFLNFSHLFSSPHAFCSILSFLIIFAILKIYWFLPIYHILLLTLCIQGLI